MRPLAGAREDKSAAIEKKTRLNKIGDTSLDRKEGDDTGRREGSLFNKKKTGKRVNP